MTLFQKLKSMEAELEDLKGKGSVAELYSRGLPERQKASVPNKERQKSLGYSVSSIPGRDKYLLSNLEKHGLLYDELLYTKGFKAGVASVTDVTSEKQAEEEVLQMLEDESKGTT